MVSYKSANASRTVDCPLHGTGTRKNKICRLNILLICTLIIHRNVMNRTVQTCQMLAHAYLSKINRMMIIITAMGTTAPKSSSCGYTFPSVLLRSAQVTLEGNQNLSFQNQDIPPAMMPDRAMIVLLVKLSMGTQYWSVPVIYLERKHRMTIYCHDYWTPANFPVCL